MLRKQFKRDHISGDYTVYDVGQNPFTPVTDSSISSISFSNGDPLLSSSPGHDSSFSTCCSLVSTIAYGQCSGLECSEVLDSSYSFSSTSSDIEPDLNTHIEQVLHGQTGPATESHNIYYHEPSSQMLYDEPLASQNQAINLDSVHWHSRNEAVQGAVDFLADRDRMERLCNLLFDESLLKDFIGMLDMFLSGKLPITNIPFLASMDRSRFESLGSTTGMRFRDDMKRFWATVMRLGRGRLLDLLSGKKSAGNVVKNLETQGNFNPRNASVNFVIPSREILSNHLQIIPKSIEPGIVYSTFDMLDLSRQHILMFDGKKIGPGLGDYPNGDVNLLGLEGPPNLTERMENHQRELKICEDISALLYEDDQLNGDANKPLTKPLIKNLLQAFAKVICSLQHQIARSQRQVLKLTSYVDDKMPQRYDFAISNEKGKIYMGNNWLTDAGETIDEFLSYLSCISQTHAFMHLESEINLTKCGNYKSLHSVDSILRNRDIALHPGIIQQKSETWFEIRANAVITGSTAWSALGFRGLPAQKRHFKEYVKGNVRTNLQNRTQTDRMQHGTVNEKNGIATCVAALMPALLPPCYIFKEQGSYFVHGKNRADMICVSPDGLLVCQYNEGDSHSKLSHARHKPIVVEIKCPFPSKGQVPLHYKLPIYYSLQVLLEMHVTQSESCWYISYSKDWTSLIQVQYDADLTSEVLRYASAVFDHNIPEVPDDQTQTVQSLKVKIESYITNNSSFLCTVRSKTATDVYCKCLSIDQPYHTYENEDPLLDTDIHVQLYGTTGHSQQILKESFQMLREKGQEIITGVLTDADRLYNPDIPSNMPVVYGLKSYSLPVEIMRKFVNKTRQVCHEQKVKILCEAYDGQWCQLVFKNAQNQPLTRFQLQRNCWHRAKNMSKRKLLEYFVQISCVADEDLTFWGSHSFSTSGRMSSGNLEVELCVDNDDKCQSQLFLSTPGWDEENLNDTEILQHPRKFMYDKAATHNYRTANSVQKKIAYQMDINDIIQYLPDFVWDDAEGSDVDQSHRTELDLSKVSVRSSFSMDSDTGAHSHPNILKSILHHLRKTKFSGKYVDMTERELYFKCLGSSEAIGSNFTVIELDAVNNAICELTQKSVFLKSERKINKVNKLGKVFGDVERWFPSSRRKYTPKSLKALTQNHIMKSGYPKIILTSAYASVLYSKEELKWEEASPLPTELRLQGESEPFNLFCYPEYCAEREQLEPRIIDPSHILNNVRAKICRSGIDSFSKHTVQRLAACKDRHIESLMINQILDQQNTELSLRFFSTYVEDKLRAMDEDDAADFVQVFRGWYRACDERGIEALERIRLLMAMHKYLMMDYEFHLFPPPGRYFRGIPLQTVEAILHNISMRMLLYLVSETGQVNHRALATLGVECFYSLMAFMDYNGLNCPKATQLKYLLSHLVSLNHIQTNPDRNFYMQSKKKSKYPQEEMETQLKSKQANDDDVFKTNLFDIPMPRYVKRRIKVAQRVNSIFGQEVGYKGVRQHFKSDSTRISILDKLGVNKADITDL